MNINMNMNKELINNRKKILKFFYDTFFEDIYFFDIGASLPINEFLDIIKDKTKIFFFEPNKKEANKLTNFLRNNFNNYEVIPKAVSNKKNVNFYYYKNYQLNSSKELLKNNFFINKNFSKLIKKEKLKCVDICSIIKKYSVDSKKTILKVDAQGSSLDVLKSGFRTKNNFPVILCEIDKIPYYKNQDMDFDVIKFLTKKNYLPLGNISNYYKSSKFNNNSFFSKELNYSSDIFFIKNPFKTNLSINDTKIILMYCLIFNFLDFGQYLLNLNLSHFEKNFINRYSRLSKNLLMINKKIISTNIKVIHKNRKYSEYFNLLNFNSEQFNKKYFLF